MRTLTSGQKRLAVFSLVIAAMLLAALSAQAQWVTTTLDAESFPWAVAVNPATNMIYAANVFSDTVT